MKSVHIGVGGFGAGWTRRFSDSPDWEIAALVDPSEAALADSGDRLGVPKSLRFTDADEALRRVEADAAVISCPSPHHKDYFLKACDRGLHVLVDKAMATSLEDGVQMTKAITASGMVGLVAQNYRYLPPFVALRSSIAGGRVGQVDNCLVVWRHPAHQIGSYRSRTGDAMLIDGSIHHVDLMRYLLDSNAVAVQAYGRQPPYSWSASSSVVGALIEFEGDVFVEFHANWTSHDRESDWEADWRVEGTDGALRWQDGWDHLKWSWHDRTKGQSQPGGHRTETFPLPQPQDDLGRLLEDFTVAIRSGTQPQTTPSDNIHSLALVFAIVLACRSRQRVLLEDILREAGL